MPESMDSSDLTLTYPLMGEEWSGITSKTSLMTNVFGELGEMFCQAAIFGWHGRDTATTKFSSSSGTDASENMPSLGKGNTCLAMRVWYHWDLKCFDLVP